MIRVWCILCSLFFFFNDTATTEIYPLSLHDALPICSNIIFTSSLAAHASVGALSAYAATKGAIDTLVKHFASVSIAPLVDRKSTRLNSSHVRISYAVFCLKKKKKNHRELICSPMRQL